MNISVERANTYFDVYYVTFEHNTTSDVCRYRYILYPQTTAASGENSRCTLSDFERGQLCSADPGESHLRAYFGWFQSEAFAQLLIAKWSIYADFLTLVYDTLITCKTSRDIMSAPCERAYILQSMSNILSLLKISVTNECTQQNVCAISTLYNQLIILSETIGDTLMRVVDETAAVVVANARDDDEDEPNRKRRRTGRGKAPHRQSGSLTHGQGGP